MKPSAPVEMTDFGWLQRFEMAANTNFEFVQLDAGDLVGCDFDVETDEEIGDALVIKAALAQETDLVREHGDHLGSGEVLLGTAGGFAELAGGAGDLVGSVGELLLHRDLQTFCVALRR